MPRTYPEQWDAIAQRIKERAGWRCERCGHPHDRESGHVLTVAHLDPAYGHQRWNLAPLCQRCHLKYEHRLSFRQGYMYEHSEWFKPHVEAWERWRLVRRAYRLNVMLCVNSPETGLHTGRVVAVDLQDTADCELASLREACAGARMPTCRVTDTRLRIGRRTFPILGYAEWVGNWCWDQARVTVATAARITNHLKATGKFFAESGVVPFGELWEYPDHVFLPRDFVAGCLEDER